MIFFFYDVFFLFFHKLFYSYTTHIFLLFQRYLRTNKELKYCIRCFFLVEFSQGLFQNINSDNNTTQMATATSHKDEVQPFAAQRKF